MDDSECVVVLTDSYFAGLFDGEGCVNAHLDKRGFIQISAKVAMCDREPIDALRQRFGGYFIDGHTTPSVKRPIYTWAVYNGDAVEALELFSRLCLVKRTAALAAIPLAASLKNNPGKAILTRHEKELRIKAAEEVRAACTRWGAIKGVDPEWRAKYLEDKDRGSDKVRRQIRLSDGREFKSVTDAARALGVSGVAVCCAIKRRGKVAGFSAEYLS